MLDDRLIEAFLSIVERGNITKAAEQLFLSQSTLSYRLKTLESQLGVKLIVRQRGNQGISLTSRGSAFVPLARRWLELSRDIERFCVSAEELQSLRVVAPESMNLFMQGTYESIIRNETGMGLSLSTAPSRYVADIIERGDADIGLSYLDASEREGVICKAIGETRIVVLRKGAQSAEGKGIEAALDPNKAIAIRGITLEHPAIAKWFEKTFGQGFGPSFEVDSPQMLRNFMMEGSWCLIPTSAVSLFSMSEGYFVHELAERTVVSWYRIVGRADEDRLEKFCARHFPILGASERNI